MKFPRALALPMLLAPIALARQAPPAPAPATRPSLNGSPMLPGLLADEPAGGAGGAGGKAVASFDEARVTQAQLDEFLLRTRGLDAMLNLMQLEVAKTLARREGITIGVDDVRAETRDTLRQAVAGQAGADEIGEDQYPALLQQLLARQQLSEAEFDVVMATNTYLKALAKPRIKAAMTDEALRKTFEIRYGAQVQVRHIQADNLAAITAAKKRLDAGEAFETVAAQVSTNAESKRQGGLLPPFAVQSDIPQAFKEAAFSLEVGQVSEAVEADGAYHLIQLVRKIDPTAVKFEDVKDELATQLLAEQSTVVMAQLRRNVAQMLASSGLVVNDSVLKEQLQLRLAAIRPRAMTKGEMSKQMEGERLPVAPPATRPTP